MSDNILPTYRFWLVTNERRDYYAPEINRRVPCRDNHPHRDICPPIPDKWTLAIYTEVSKTFQCYDTLKVMPILNEIDGKTHNGNSPARAHSFGIISKQ